MNNADKPTYIQIPEEYTRRQLNTMYREVPLKDTVSRQLRKYFNAMANLYGFIPLRKAWDIISTQSPTLATKDEFLAFAEIARHECEDYYILRDDEIYSDGKANEQLDWKIIDVILLYDEDGALYDIVRGQHGKPYYVPPKKQLLAYDDSSYYEPTPQTEKMIDFLSNRIHLTPENAEVAFEDILLYTRSLYGGFQKVFSRLEQLGAKFNDTTMNDFAAIYQDFSNNTRMQFNRGHTPDEILALSPPEDRDIKSLSFGPNIRNALVTGTLSADEFHQTILETLKPDDSMRDLMLDALANASPSTTARSKPAKIGRNDPCPCGSGKKYKKCCGR